MTEALTVVLLLLLLLLPLPLAACQMTPMGWAVAAVAAAAGAEVAAAALKARFCKLIVLPMVARGRLQEEEEEAPAEGGRGDSEVPCPGSTRIPGLGVACLNNGLLESCPFPPSIPPTS